MTQVTQILCAIEQGNPAAVEQLLPLVYEELRALAAQRLAEEKPGQTLQATALVHEAYLRLVDVERAVSGQTGWEPSAPAPDGNAPATWVGRAHGRMVPRRKAPLVLGHG